MFTRQQIEEIKRGLEFYSRKDSQLPESPLPLDGTELVSIIKNGQNVVTAIDNVADPEGQGHRENPLIYHKGFIYLKKSKMTKKLLKIGVLCCALLSCVFVLSTQNTEAASVKTAKVKLTDGTSTCT